MTPDLATPEAAVFRIDDKSFVAPALAPGLYPVATPIGNLSDITLRALEVLAAADLVVCEDTRVSRVLLDRYGIRKPLAVYEEHSAARERPRLIAMLRGGMRLALISDAGTPLLSDPGYKLVEAAIAEDVAVIPVPGPSALLSALAGAGLPTDCFVFLGFLPHKETARRQKLSAFASVPASLVAYESPHRVADTLADMAAVLGGDRPAAIARELTKRFEEFRRGTLDELLVSARETPPRGEIVLVVGPPVERIAPDDDLEALLVDALARSGPGKAAAEIARITGRPRKEVYALALKLRASGETGEGDNADEEPDDEAAP